MTPPKGLSTTTYGRRLLWWWLITAVLSAVISGTTLFISDQALITPFTKYLVFAGGFLFIVSNVLGVISAAFLKTDASHKLGFYAMVIGVITTLVVFAILILTEGTPDLAEGETISGELEVSSSARHIFEAEPGSTIVLRIATQGKLEVSAYITNGEERIPVSRPPEGDDLELSKVVVGGNWTLQIDAVNNTSGRYHASYDIVDSPRDLVLQTPHRGERIGRANSENGYVVQLDEPAELRITVVPSFEGLPLGLSVYRNTRTEVENPAAEDDGSYTILLRIRPGSTYVIVVRGQGVAGSYTITADIQPSDQAPTTSTSSPPQAEIEMPSVYNLTEADAYAALLTSGLAGESIQVCSGSVAAGRVRQAFVVETDGKERIVDDEPEVTIDTTKVKADQIIYLKISTGAPCS